MKKRNLKMIVSLILTMSLIIGMSMTAMAGVDLGIPSCTCTDHEKHIYVYTIQEDNVFGYGYNGTGAPSTELRSFGSPSSFQIEYGIDASQIAPGKWLYVNDSDGGVCDGGSTSPTCPCTNPDHVEHYYVFDTQTNPFDEKTYVTLYMYNQSGFRGVDYSKTVEELKHDYGLDDVVPGMWIHISGGGSTPTSKKASECSHDYAWKTTKEPTVDEAGVTSLICSKCGSVEMQKPVANDMLVYQSYANELEKQIKNAQPGDTLKLDLNAWHSVPQFLMERIIGCGYDVELTYKYKGVKYDIVIKAGQGQNLDIPWYGPLLMNSMYAK